MTEEELKAIKKLTEIKELVEENLGDDVEVNAILDSIDLRSLCIVLDLIKNQQKEIVNRDKIIDTMAEELRYQNGMQQNDIFCVEICKGKKCNKEQCKDKIKQYFINKAEEK